MNALFLETRPSTQGEPGRAQASALDEAIATATVLDLDGGVVSLGQLLSGQRSLLVFVRHYG